VVKLASPLKAPFGIDVIRLLYKYLFEARIKHKNTVQGVKATNSVVKLSSPVKVKAGVNVIWLVDRSLVKTPE
jgi:hypothetical protein